MYLKVTESISVLNTHTDTHMDVFVISILVIILYVYGHHIIKLHTLKYTQLSIIPNYSSIKFFFFKGPQYADFGHKCYTNFQKIKRKLI